MADKKQNTGSIVEIKGVVLDAVFADELPAIYSALSIQTEHGELIAEVEQHLGDDRVRAVAMDSTDGLARGTEVIDTGAPITVPVGPSTLGRIFNLLGQPIDFGDPLDDDVERWPIHRAAPTVEALIPTTEMFETGI